MPLVYLILAFMSTIVPRPGHISHVSHYYISEKYTWAQTGPEGGYIHRVLVDPDDSSLALALGFVVWVTRDGENWQFLMDNGINAMGTFTSRHRLLLYTNDTLYYSNDGAVTFVPIKSNRYFAITERVSDTVLVIYDSLGVAYLGKTTDGGLNWSIITPLSYPYYYAISYAPSNDSIIYLAAKINNNSDSVYIIKSEDGGLTWNVASFIGEDVDVKDIEINPDNPQEGFVSCGFDGSGLIYTDDGFQSIEALQEILIPFDVEFIGPDSVLVASTIPTGVYLGTRSVLGWLFTPEDTLTNCSDLENSDDTIWYAAALTGMLKSTDNATTFQRMESGLYATFTYFQKAPSEMVNRTVYFPSYQGNALYVSRNGGITWEKKYLKNVAIIFDVEAYPQDENIVYAAVGAGEIDPLNGFVLHNILYSQDGGNTFVPMDTITGNPDTLHWIETISTVNDSPDVLLGIKYVNSDTGSDMYYITRSSDGGHSFSEVMGPYTSLHDGFAGKSPIFFQADSVIYVSYDHGMSFDTLFKFMGADMVQNLTYYPSDTVLFFNLYTNTDSVYSYRIPDSTVSNYYIPGLYLLYAAKNGGIYSLVNLIFQNVYFYSGTYTDPFSQHEQNTLLSGAIRASDNEVLLFSYGMGVFRSQDAVSETYERDKDEFSIPNTLISKGTLYLGRKLRGEKVDIYSIAGERVSSERVSREGNIDVSHLPSGVYLVRSTKISGLIKILKIR